MELDPTLIGAAPLTLTYYDAHGNFVALAHATITFSPD